MANIDRRGLLQRALSIPLLSLISGDEISNVSNSNNKTNSSTNLEQTINHALENYRELPTIYEFVEHYMKDCLPTQKDPSVVNILYPGSGWDYIQLAMGLEILHKSSVEKVDYVFTEVGDFNRVS